MKAGEAHKLHDEYDETDGIGGSGVAAALGLSKFLTKRQLYERLIGEGPERPDNRFMYWGRMLEGAIATSFSERTGLKLRRSKKTYRHPVHGFLKAHVDRLGYGFVFEAKTAGTFAGKLDWGETLSLDEITPETWSKELYGSLSDDIPDDYGLQLQHYMELTNREHAFLAVLVGGNEAKLYRAERDRELYREMILPGLVKFWRAHVEKRVPPELEAGDEEGIRARFPRAEDDLIISPSDVTEAAGEKLLETKREKAALEKREKHLRAVLEEAIAEHEGMIGGSFKITWKNDPDREEVEWKLYAEALERAVEPLARVDASGDGRMLMTGAQLIEWLRGMHTKTKKGSRRFLISELKKEEA